MPVWNTTQLTNDEQSPSLNQLMVELRDEIVADSPTFYEVTGVTTAQLRAHAQMACEAFVGSENLIEGNGLVRLYSLGFVIGSRYGQQLAAQKE